MLTQYLDQIAATLVVIFPSMTHAEAKTLMLRNVFLLNPIARQQILGANGITQAQINQVYLAYYSCTKGTSC